MDIAKAQEIIAKRARVLEAKKATNAKYKASHLDTFHKRQCGYQKKHYDKTKKDLIDANIAIGIIPIVKVNPYILPEVNEVIIQKDIIPSYINNNTKKGVSPDNVAKYLKIINNVHTKYTENTLDIDVLTRIFDGSYDKTDVSYIAKNIKYITTKNIDNFIQYMKDTYTNSNTLQTYILPYIIITSYISKYKISYQILSKLNKQCSTIYSNERDKNIITDNNKIISYNPIKIDEMLADNTNFNNSKSKLIFGLYTILITRRLEMASVILTDNTNIDELNDTNYLIIDKDGYTLVFNQYKTFKSFGKNIVSIPTSLKLLIDKYCFDFDIIIGSPLFTTNADKTIPISNLSFGKLLSKVFTTIYNTHLSLNNLRMSCSTYHNSLNLSLEENKRFANAMCHNLETNLQYVRKNC